MAVSRERKDRSGNWIIEKHGDSLSRLANIGTFTDWKPASTVLSFPKRTPDGLLDVTFSDLPTPDPFLIEIESFPQADTAKQVRDDAAMVLLSRGVLPDILLIVLRPKGNQAVDAEQLVVSTHGWSELRLRIRVLRMWELAADQLLAANDVGLIPWVPLADYSAAEALLQQCKERIEQQARPEEKENLLATTQVMAEKRYDDAKLLSILGGSPMSLEQVFLASPSVQFFMAKTARENTRKHIFRRLEKRFGSPPEDLAAHLRAIDDQQKLDALLDVAIECADLSAFRAAMNEFS
jgi:hypothetical protein